MASSPTRATPPTSRRARPSEATPGCVASAQTPCSMHCCTVPTCKTGVCFCPLYICLLRACAPGCVCCVWQHQYKWFSPQKLLSTLIQAKSAPCRLGLRPALNMRPACLAQRKQKPVAVPEQKYDISSARAGGGAGVELSSSRYRRLSSTPEQCQERDGEWRFGQGKEDAYSHDGCGGRSPLKRVS